MPILLKDKGRKYKRFQHTQDEKRVLQEKGLVPVVSSNVSAIAQNGERLVVRFHGGATYEYPTSGDLYARMLNSTSKGKFVWRHLIRKNVPYRRISNTPMVGDEKFVDTDLMEQQKQVKVKGAKTVPRETLETIPIKQVPKVKANTLKSMVKVTDLLALGIIAEYMREDKKATNA